VGRLDKETSGLLLLTDDGQLLHRIKSPSKRALGEGIAWGSVRGSAALRRLD